MLIVFAAFSELGCFAISLRSLIAFAISVCVAFITYSVTYPAFVCAASITLQLNGVMMTITTL